MAIQLIRTEADYEAALAEIERRFDAAPNTPDSDRLDVLTALVEAYEAHHYPIPEPGPVEAINYYMESRGLSRADWSHCSAAARACDGKVSLVG